MIEGSAPTTGRSADVPETQTDGLEVLETREWLDSLDYVLYKGGPDRAGRLLQQLSLHARRQAGVNLPFTATTPYQNTIASRQQPPFPGSQEMERRIKSLVRWNALAMVVRANKMQEGIGGHISTFASSATLYEVAFNHFLHAKTESGDRDIVYFQGHAAPGMYARAYLEGRITAAKLENFRRELKAGGGLSSYPHPWLMPDFWEFPTVSMGLGPICAIYQARFMRYLEDRGLKKRSDSKVWAFLGDGETDEQLKKLTLGGHDPSKVHAAYNVAVSTTGQPTVILARTIKGYGIGEAGEGKNITHQQKKMNEEELRAFRTRFGIPIADAEIAKTPFYRPPEDSAEVRYMRERRQALGGYVPTRKTRSEPVASVPSELFEGFYQGTEGR